MKMSDRGWALKSGLVVIMVPGIPGITCMFFVFARAPNAFQLRRDLTSGKKRPPKNYLPS